MTRIMIADDHALVRDGLKHILGRASNLEIVGEAADNDGVMRLIRAEHADVLLLDLSMPGGNGIDLVRRVKRERPALRILILTMHAEQQYAVRAFKAGASGYLTKESAASELVDAIARVGSGHVYLSASMAENFALALASPQGEEAAHATLSDRELDVYRRIVAGESLTAIAAALTVSPKTVSTYKARILEKMRMSNDAALIRHAVKHQLFDENDPL